MKKILISFSTIALVAILAVGATRSYFSATQTSTGNTITAGTIAISVDDQNPWTKTYSQNLLDMKPGMTRTITFVVKNTGTNPVVLRKQVGGFELGGTLTSGYCTANGGITSGSACLNASTTPPQDLSNVMTYDMTVTSASGTTVMIPDSWNVKMSDIKDLWIPLGTLQPNDTLSVTQSYHFDEATGNWAQGDTLAFNISLYAEQVGGVGPNTIAGVVLDNKDTTSWASLVDGTLGILRWDATTGAYTLKAFGLTNGLTYGVAYWNGSTETLIDAVSGAPTSGQLTLSGTYAAFNTNSKAKYWLRPIPWTSTSDVNTLWEDNLVHQ